MRARDVAIIALGCAAWNIGAAAQAAPTVAEIAFRAASASHLHSSAIRIDTKARSLGYDLMIQYGQDVDFEPEAREVLTSRRALWLQG